MELRPDETPAAAPGSLTGTVSHWASFWESRSRVLYFNHGAFGLPPRPVVEARRALLDELEQNPMDFFVRRLDRLLDESACRLAETIGCRPNDLVLVPNSTVAMNIVVAACDLQSGDEILLTDHDYGAVVRAWGRRCGDNGARTVLARPAEPLSDPQQIIDALQERIGPRTKMIVVSHVSSPTAVVFPVEEICRLARERGIPTCIDGPHALMTRELDLRSLGCDYYAASCHKWLSAPFGSGFLYVHPRRQGLMHPVITSWGRPLSGRTPRWQDEFHWFGTYDPTPMLAIPAAIDFLTREVGLERFRTETHSLARYARQQIEALTGEPALVPDDPAWYGPMIALPLPGVAPTSEYPVMTHPLQQALWEDEQIEVPIIEWRGRIHIRISCHLYHSMDDVDRLVAAVQRQWPKFRGAASP